MNTSIYQSPSKERVPNTSKGITKDRALRLEDGYLSRAPISQYILLSICFPMWGITASLSDTLITQFKSVFSLSGFASASIQSAFYGGYFLIAVPASRMTGHSGYRVGILIGLNVYIIGCSLFFPVSHMATYSMFLVPLFAIAVDLSFLETSCNTYSSMIGPKRLSTLHLSISQTFYPLDSIGGILPGKYLIFTQDETLHEQMASVSGEESVQFAREMLQRTLHPYCVIILVLLVLLIVIAITQFPRCKPIAYQTRNEVQATTGETLAYLSHNRRFMSGISTQFPCIGMQTAVWSFTIRLALNIDHGLNERATSNFMILSFIGFFTDRFIASLLMTKINQDLVLVGYSILGLTSLLYVIFVPDMTAVHVAVLMSTLFGSCWATIYSRALDTIEDKRFTETGGAAVVMSIIGGAMIPAVQGLVSDLTGSMQVSFSVNLVCFAAALIYLIFASKNSREGL